MMARKLLDGLRFTYARNSSPMPDINIAEIATSAETVSKNAIFVCTKTALRDGHYSVAAAYDRGCRIFVAERGIVPMRGATVLLTADTEAILGVLADRCYGYPTRGLTVFGITGTHGKSAVALLTAALLRQSGRRVAVLTSDGADDGACFTPAGSMAPDAVDLRRFLHRSRANGVEFAILEFSSYMLKHGAAKGISFAAVLLTDLSPCHIGYAMHRDIAAYRAAKEQLFEDEQAVCFLPHTVTDFSAKGRCVIYGEGGAVRADAVTPIEGGGYGFDLFNEEEKMRVMHPAIGFHAVHNAVGAAALALRAGLSLAEVSAGLATATPMGRLEQVAKTAGRAVYMDVAYTEEELKRALRALRAVTAGRLTVLLGSVGGRAKERRAPLGAAAGNFADHIWFTADDPDSEAPDNILEDLTADMPRAARYSYIPDRAEAIAAAVAELRSGDALLVCGKAQEETQLVCGQKLPFSDRERIKTALEEISFFRKIY